MDKYAAIDLGTNTFHLLIASLDDDGKLTEHFRSRSYIHLAKDGIERISDSAIDRALACVQEFSDALKKFDITDVICSGTAALRTAENGQLLVGKIEAILGLPVNVIDGITEAKYIYHGVSLAIPSLRSGNHMIMDIGGGSVEFIIIKDGHFYWSNSYPIGIAVLKRLFHKSEPIDREELFLINQFIRDHLCKLLYIAKGMTFQSLVGASGSFEVLSQMVNPKGDDLKVRVSVDRFLSTYKGIVGQSLEERLERDDIPEDRAPLIVVAFQLMHFIVTHFRFNHLAVSKYAMKEGMIMSLMMSDLEEQEI